jgi:hypothetical protein
VGFLFGVDELDALHRAFDQFSLDGLPLGARL